MNLLSKSDVFAENKLFATLDTTVRKVVFGSMPFLLSDTVGFIRKLPHHLIESFKSTLDEVKESDLLLHVIDLSHPQFEDHIKTVHQTLKDLECLDKPMLMVFNKYDAYKKNHFDDYVDEQTRLEIENELRAKMKNNYEHDNVFISAITKENIDILRNQLTELIQQLYLVRYPYRKREW